MKKILNFTLMLLLAIGLSSCDKLKNLADIEFDTTLSGNLNILVEEPGTKSALVSYSFSANTNINPLDDDNVAKYIDNIKDWSVNGITARVVSVNKPNVVFLSGTFFKVSNNTHSAQWTLPVDFSVVENAQFSLDNSGGAWDAVRQILLKNSAFNIMVDGECTENDVTVVIKLSIGAKVTANPL